MKLTVTNEAADWFIDEMGLEQGESVQFFLKIYGGIPTAHPNYFLGLRIGDTTSVGVKTEVKGILFYFRIEDNWFLEQYDVEIVKKDDEVEYLFHVK